MRPRLLLACLLIVFLALLAAGTVGATGKPLGRYAQADGTLSLQGGRGSFALLTMTGSVLGRIDKGTLTVTRDPSEGTVIVRGQAWMKVRSATTVQYGGKKPIRFRILGGRFDLRIDGAVGAELSVIGRGRAMLDGAGFDELGLSDGEYSLNDAPYVTVPSMRTWLTVKAPPKNPPPPPKRGQRP